MKQKRTLEIILGIIGFSVILGAFLFGGLWCREYLLSLSRGTADAVLSDKKKDTLNDFIRVSSPKENDLLVSPLHVRGEARGYWYFEASFPVKLLDSNGKELYVGPIQADGEWMTEDFVPFDSTVVFTQPQTKTGVLVLQRDNPSGLPENEKEIQIPVRFK